MAVSQVEVRKIALALPGSIEAPHFDRTSFRAVRSKSARIFATMPADGGSLNVFVDHATIEEGLVRYAPCAEKLFWGKRVCGLKLTLAAATRTTVKALLFAAHKHAIR